MTVAAGTVNRADLVRVLLARLRALDPDQADEVEETWPLTLATLDGPESATVIQLPAWRMQDVLARELGERISEAEQQAADA